MWRSGHVRDIHFKNLSWDLNNLNFLHPDGSLKKDKLGNILQFDEMPSMLGEKEKVKSRYYFPTASSTRLVAKAENRHCITVDVTVGRDNHFYDPHFIIAGGADYTDLVVKDMPNALITANETYMQTRQSFLARMKHLLVQVKARGINRPYLLIGDGHASRYSLEFFQWADAEGVHLYIEPPNTSHKLQMLDQGFKGLHDKYTEALRRWRRAHPHERITRQVFFEVMADALRKHAAQTHWEGCWNKVRLIRSAHNVMVLS
jgi:hypothetical protein